MAHEAWAEQQLAELVRLGVDVEDAQATVEWVLANLPADADPATWIPPAELLMADATITPAQIEDARTNWYARDSVPPKFKRLLDARGDDDAG